MMYRNDSARSSSTFAMWVMLAVFAFAHLVGMGCTPDAGNNFRMVESSGASLPESVRGTAFGGTATAAPEIPSEAPPESQSLIDRGYLRLRLGDFAGAIDAFTGYIAERGGDVSVYLGRGRAFSAVGELDSAIEDFSLAISIDPQFAELYEERADALISAGRLEDALKDLGELARLRPGDPVAYRQRAMVYLDLDRPELVESEIELAGALFGRSAVDYFILGLAQFRLEDYVSALASQNRALDAGREQDLGNSFSAAVLTSRGQTNFRLMQYDRAYEDFSRALQLGGPDVQVYELRAEVLSSEERYAEAAADHARAIEVDPNNATLYNNLADSQMLAGNLASALLTVETALRLDAALGIAHYTKGEILEKMQQPEAARQSFDRAAEFGFTADSFTSAQ